MCIIFRIRDIVSKWPGSHHDSVVFDASGIKQYLSGDNIDGWLLGDAGYPLRPYLLTPVRNPQTFQEEQYNRAHKATRNIIERTYGLLKARFR